MPFFVKPPSKRPVLPPTDFSFYHPTCLTRVVRGVPHGTLILITWVSGLEARARGGRIRLARRHRRRRRGAPHPLAPCPQGIFSCPADNGHNTEKGAYNNIS